jgi:Carboxypeptidase regulatory-like domain
MNWLVLISAMLLFQAGAARPQERSSVSGYIVKMGTGEPVSKAIVTLSAFNGGRQQSYTATTTTSGQFSFQNLESGQYRLSATRNGYARMEYGARSPNKPGLPLVLSAGQKLTDVVLQIMPAGTIAGRVFDRDGEPLANVSVEALRYSYQEGQRVMNQVQTARTNDLGEYRIFWLQPGQYFVSATPPDNKRTPVLNDGPDDAAAGYVPVYYPGTTDSQSAAPINLSPGIVFSGVDLTVATVRTVRVQGRVINGVNGQPAQNANIMLLPVQRTAGGFRGGVRNPGNQRNRINNQGTFDIRGVVPGSYELVAVVNERNNRMSARLPLEVGASDIQNVSLIVSPGFTLTGRLSIEGQASSGANSNASRMRVMLRPDSAAQVGGAPPASPVQNDGTFTLEQVGRDDYRLTVSGMPRNAYVKTARYGATDVMMDGLRLDRQPTGPLEIIVSTNTGTADGVVQNEKQEPSANVTVVLVPEATRRTRMDLYRTTSTDAMGHFHVEGVPPGDYRVFAWEDVETGAWLDPDFIRQFEDRGRPIRINESGTSKIELRVITP